MLGSVHVTERLCHHNADYLYRIRGIRAHTDADYPVNPHRMTVIADVVTVDTPRFAVFLHMTECTLRLFVLFKIFQRRFADETLAVHAFFSHGLLGVIWGLFEILYRLLGDYLGIIRD